MLWAKIIVMNWDMIGHEWAVGMLKEHVTRDQLRHAYLFTGPLGVGRRTLALRLAQAVNCSEPPEPGEPCRTCRNCTQIERMQHPDLTTTQAELRGTILKVEQIRDLQRSLSLKPYQARYRIALLLHFEEANLSAANALLKTLEEPASQVILILTAESVESLLPTIVSRCEVLRLRPLPVALVAEVLERRWEIPTQRAQLLASLSDGRPGYAVYLHQHQEILDQRQEMLEIHRRLLANGRVERFAFAEKLTKEHKENLKEKMRDLLLVWLSYWRDILMFAAGASVSLANQDRAQEVEKLATGVGVQPAKTMVSALERTLEYLECNVNPRLAFEVLMLDMPYTSPE
jgi:DNA polymerase-3 subunit delta'